MVVGLVGKSCSGKNLVGSMLSGLGLEVWDLDVVAHDGLEANAKAIEGLFGPEAVGWENGKPVISRQAIGKIVFSDPKKRKALEDILYPWLKVLVKDWVKTHADGVLVLNGALLYRSGFNKLCDHVIYVDASYKVRCQRAIKRDGITEEVFRLREASQEDVDYRVVDYGVPIDVVSTEESDMDKLRQQVFNICSKLGIIKQRM